MNGWMNKNNEDFGESNQNSKLHVKALGTYKTTWRDKTYYYSLKCVYQEEGKQKESHKYIFYFIVSHC